ncbi:MAG: aspartate-semialdehyde dehydrogenase [Clostridia bacterium]|nr:aspartate-semialdehyde dehydrogenase [Clostridia bacterium]
MKEYKIAVVGATGLVGRKVIEVLEEYQLPISSCEFFASRKSAGTDFYFNGKRCLVKELKETSFDEGFDFAIFTAGGEVSKQYAPIAVQKGCIVIDNSSAFRMDPNVPLVVPEVNPEEILNNNGIIANPNCSTIQAVLPLKVLDEKYSIKRIVYSTYQAVSGAGHEGVSDLERGLQGEEPKKFPYQIVNNCIPHIDSFLENGYTKEEEKMINETRKILKKPDLKITATTVRVPVINSHSESINVEFENQFDLEELKNVLKNAPGVIVQDDIKNNIYPLATSATGHDETFVGRIRRDFSVESGINFWCVSDNIRKGAASNAVQIVKKLIENDNN